MWQNVNTKSAHGVKPMCTYLGCHVGEDFPCKNLLVGSMTWTWSSWDRHRMYRWNCGNAINDIIVIIHTRSYFGQDWAKRSVLLLVCTLSSRSAPYSSNRIRSCHVTYNLGNRNRTELCHGTLTHRTGRGRR